MSSVPVYPELSELSTSAAQSLVRVSGAGQGGGRNQDGKEVGLMEKLCWKTLGAPSVFAGKIDCACTHRVMGKRGS